MSNNLDGVKVIPASERSDVPAVASRLPTPRPIPPTPILAQPSVSEPSPSPKGGVAQPLSIQMRHNSDVVTVTVRGRAAGWVVEVETWNPYEAPHVLFERAYDTGTEALEIFWLKIADLQGRMQR